MNSDFLEKIAKSNTNKKGKSEDSYKISLKTDNPDFSYIEAKWDFWEIYHVFKHVLREAKRKEKNIIVNYDSVTITLQKWEDIGVMLDKIKDLSKIKGRREENLISLIPCFVEEEND